MEVLLSQFRATHHQIHEATTTTKVAQLFLQSRRRMIFTNTMRLTLFCLALASSAVNAKDKNFDGFLGRPSGKVVDGEKKQELETQLRASLMRNSVTSKARGSGEPHFIEGADANKEQGRDLGYYEYYYDDDDYYGADDYYYHKKATMMKMYPKYYYHSSSKKKSKMGGKKGKSKKWGGKMGKSKKWQGMYKWNGGMMMMMKWAKGNMNGGALKVPDDDHILDMVFQDDTVFTDDILEDEDCELFVAAEAFSFGSWDTNVVTPQEDFTGDEYIWNPNFMQDRSSDDLIDAQFSGYCKMTSNIDTYCHFVIVNNVGDQITMAGTLTTPTSALESGGVLAITGGTGAMAGVIGEATVFANPIGAHFIEVATRFDVDVTLGIIVCKPQKLPVY